MKTDLFSKTEMVRFVQQNLYPIEIIYKESEFFIKRTENAMDLNLNGNAYISPPLKWFGSCNDKESGLFEVMHEVRLLRK